jgi:hypothetical protein
VYYWPLPGEDMGQVEVVAPRLQHLVELRGDTELGLPVLFAATGEKIDDWAPFDAELFVQGLFTEN